MALYQNEVLQYVVDDEYFDVDEFHHRNDLFAQNDQLPVSDDDTDEMERDHVDTKFDTSAAEARKGKDIQGISWERVELTRDEHRNARLKQYKSYVSLSYSRDDVLKQCKQVKKGYTFYDFQSNTRLVKPTIAHFQLRNLLWATSKHDIYVMQNYSVMYWSSLMRGSKELLNVSGHIAPSLNSRGQPLSRVQVSAMAVKENLLVVGGFQGEVICKNVNNAGLSFCSKITNDENTITNSVDIYKNSTGSTYLMAANNDCRVRVFDTENFTLLNEFTFPWSVNSTSVNADGKITAVLGDNPDCLLVDTQSGKAIENLKGHQDFSFSSAWHPNGQILATGNQDGTCRLWDVRNLSDSFAVLNGRMAAIRAVKFTSDGKYMAMAEAADFVHIFDVKTYSRAQEIDLFGEVSGISFSPDGEVLFVGVADRTYGSLMEFNRHCNCRYLDYYI